MLDSKSSVTADEYQRIESSVATDELQDTDSEIDIYHSFAIPNAVTFVGNWMRNRNTIENLGIWEALNNPNFNPLEFEGFRSQAGLNAFTLSPSRWA